MKISRFSVLCLGSLWFAACATAQDGSGPGDSDDSSGGSGAVSSGGAIGSSGTNGAFGGTAGIPAGAGSTFAGTSGLANGGASGSSAGGLANGGASGSATSGTGGTGGSGGSAPVFAAGVCAANPTMSVSYEQTNATDQIAAQYQFTNLTDTPIPVAQLKIRYFFTNEETSVWTTHIYSAQIDGATYRNIASGATLTVVKLATPLVGADSYAEIAFTDASTLAKTDTGSVNWELQPTDYNPPNEDQTNDYSFNVADTVFTPWDHIAVYQGDTLVYGCVPQSPDEGSAGAGGDTGAAGAIGAAGAD
jgi:hypothetical protein